MRWNPEPALSGLHALTFVAPVPGQEQAWSCLCPCYGMPVWVGQVSYRSFVLSSRSLQNGAVENWRRAQESSGWTFSGFGLYGLVFFRDPLQHHWLLSPVLLGSWQFNNISFSLSWGPLTLVCCWHPLPYAHSPNPLSALCHRGC